MTFRFFRKAEKPPAIKTVGENKLEKKEKTDEEMPLGMKQIYDAWQKNNPEKSSSDPAWNKFWKGLVERFYPEDLKKKIDELRSNESAWYEEEAPPTLTDKSEMAGLFREVEILRNDFEKKFIEEIGKSGISEQIKKQIDFHLYIEKISRKAEK